MVMASTMLHGFGARAIGRLLEPIGYASRAKGAAAYARRAFNACDGSPAARPSRLHAAPTRIDDATVSSRVAALVRRANHRRILPPCAGLRKTAAHHCALRCKLTRRPSATAPNGL